MLTENLQHLENLQTKLEALDADGLNRLYLRVFNSDDGELVLKDLANRCFVHSIGKTEFNKGVRSAYSNIITRLSNAVTGKKKEEEEIAV